ncbi:Substrate-binding domain-containing protein [Paraburkholderia sacchari]|uniref:substrate-binding domain-containing protein n=1 Tax=Paraburkholderia sacchari TaxID=159450 RepID=UPI0039A436AC
MKKRIGVMSGALLALVSGVLLSASAHADSGNKIALVPGAPHPYFSPWSQAAADAKKDFKISTVDFKVPAERKLNMQAELLESLMSQGYNGFGIFPGDPAGINSTVQELASNGVPVISLSGCPLEPTKVLFCMGTDLTKAAFMQTQALIKAIGGKGKIVHLAGPLIDPNTKLRMSAVEAAVKQTNGAVTLETLADTDDQEKAEQRINALLGAQKGQLAGLIATGYVQSVVAAKALRSVGDKKIKLVGTDTDPVVMDGIKDGFVTGTLAQDVYGEGYIASYALNQLAGGKCVIKPDAPFQKTPTSSRFIDSRPVYVSSANLATYKDELKKNAAAIQSTFKQTYLSCK